MTESEHKALRNYCAYMLKEFGFEFSPTDPVIPALYVIHHELMAVRKNNEMLARSVQEATKKINPTIYNFSSPGEAWKFQIAHSLKWLFIGLSLFLIIWILSNWWTNVDNLNRAETIIETSDQIKSSLLQRVKKDEKGYYYLEFTKSSGEQVRFFNEFDRIDNETVRVYLGKQ